MKRALFLVSAVALVFSAWSGYASDGGRPFSTTLSGSNEVPGPGDPDGSGEAVLQLNPGVQQICFQLTVSDIAAATASHIHKAPAGVAGPVVGPADAASDEWLLEQLLERRSGLDPGHHPASRGVLRQRAQRGIPGWRGSRAALEVALR